jgi:hypothetical protein
LRTTNHKTYDDFIKCTILPENTNICFIDDTFHAKMKHEKVYYLQSKPYQHGLTYDLIFSRISSSDIFIDKDFNILKDFRDHLFFLKKRIHVKNKCDVNMDILVTKKLMKHIKCFFDYNTDNIYIDKSTNKTMKRCSSLFKKKTRKHV